jgi:hypothetical protein
MGSLTRGQVPADQVPIHADLLAHKPRAVKAQPNHLCALCIAITENRIFGKILQIVFPNDK